MGLLDGILREALGGNAQSGESATVSPVLQAILAWVEEQGGFLVLLEKFQQGGLGGMLNSWLGAGGNHPIGGGELRSAFGDDLLGSLASRLGTDIGGASDTLAQYLPQIMDRASSAGQIDTQSVSDLLSHVFGKP
jgi:uncharacterized protein YidB (DUF937 family)